MTSVIRKAVFPAAGLGTRFLPATKAQPKEMLPLVDKPIIQYGVEEAVASGVDNIILVTGRGKNAIEDHSMSPSNSRRSSRCAARRNCSPRSARFRT
ncbi:MAG TPA: sugar phosphate nucleotidyltransferase [Vicinamibacterales bacterium]|nr:sugar phosphate nucleotidyltransferase [Vicinamibacterales bacterium]